MRLAAIFAWTLLTVALGLGPALADKRVALVIGNAAYASAKVLPNPRNDAADVAAALKRVGFETIVGLDLDKSGMDDVAIKFARAARDSDVALFYFAGHAMQHAGVNYLMPVDARLTDEADLRRMARVDEIVADLQQAKNLRILVLDSCRDNPLAEDFKRSIGTTRAVAVGRGLARIDSPSGMIVSYATQAGRTAEDGQGRNSPYSSAFVKHIEAAEEVGTIFRRISAEVYQSTRRTQLPELSLSMIGEFYFKDRPPADPAERAWAGVKDTASIAILEEFRRQHPGSAFAAFATARLEELKKSQVAVVTPPVRPAEPPFIFQPTVGVFAPASGVNPLTAERERGLKPKDTFKECEVCPEMVVVPAGSFTMGSPANEKDRLSDEGPQHTVTIGKPFAVGKFSVTFAEWDACVADGGCNGYKPKDEGWGRGNLPAINVNWDDAKSYVAWLSRKTGKTYRLLSEAEREYAARGGTTTPFWFGASISPQQANYDGYYTYGNGPKGEYRQRTMPVDSFQPNPFGLYQVHGNVREWTDDLYNDSYARASSDGSVSGSGDLSRRVLRGGSWLDFPRGLRAAARLWLTIGDRYRSVGFRLGRTLTP